jgi:hypothetical protein
MNVDCLEKRNIFVILTRAGHRIDQAIMMRNPQYFLGLASYRSGAVHPTFHFSL